MVFQSVCVGQLFSQRVIPNGCSLFDTPLDADNYPSMLVPPQAFGLIHLTEKFRVCGINLPAPVLARVLSSCYDDLPGISQTEVSELPLSAFPFQRVAPKGRSGTLPLMTMTN